MNVRLCSSFCLLPQNKWAGHNFSALGSNWDVDGCPRCHVFSSWRRAQENPLDLRSRDRAIGLDICCAEQQGFWSLPLVPGYGSSLDSGMAGPCIFFFVRDRPPCRSVWIDFAVSHRWPSSPRSSAQQTPAHWHSYQQPSAYGLGAPSPPDGDAASHSHPEPLPPLQSPHRPQPPIPTRLCLHFPPHRVPRWPGPSC